MSVPIKQAPRVSLAKNRAEAIDNVLSYLFLAEDKENWDWVDPYCDNRQIAKAVKLFQHVPLSHFDGADVSLLYESLHDTTSYGRMFFPCGSDASIEQLKTLDPHWDHAAAGYHPEILTEYAEWINGRTYLFSFSRYRTVPLREVRGLFPLRASTVLETSQAHIFADGSYMSNREYCQYFSGAWYTVGVPVGMDPPERHDPEKSKHSIWLARSMALTAEYDWSVHVGFNVRSVPTIGLPSDPVGAREVFKLRDIPPGKTRRDALRHWVSGHTRKSIAPDYPEKYIWPYLRGAEEFTWNGLYCKIQPSAFDLKKAAEYQLMRKHQAVALVS